MCGIFGYIGPGNAVDIVLKGLKNLEYRGYDSAGIGGLKGSEIVASKAVGKLEVLEEQIAKEHFTLEVALGHTRWATHGKPSILNAHPHFDQDKTLAIVHNGIVENHAVLRKMLVEQGRRFISETDTEVVANLIARFYEGDLLRAVQETLPLLQGSYAFAIVHKDFPGQIIAVAEAAPLVIGVSEGEVFLASDAQAFPNQVKEVIYLSDAELAVVSPSEIDTFDASKQRVIKTRELLASQERSFSKGDFTHYTLKEIFEQPTSLRNALFSRYSEEYGTSVLDGLGLEVHELLQVQRILILGCGTSWHAGCVASYFLEDVARIPTQAEIASEYRYKNPIVSDGTLVIAISQSGETADTIAAVRELKSKGAKILALCNVHGSTLAREADGHLFLRAGPEIGVCSTKAFTSQVCLLTLFALLMARMRHMDRLEGRRLLQALQKLPAQVEQVLAKASEIQQIALRYKDFPHMFFVGRHVLYPTALEGALKCKEISYIQSSGYPAGEMKHGPIALIGPECATVALCANELTYPKILSNLQEIKARGGRVFAIASEGSDGLEGLVDDIFYHPVTLDPFAPILTSVVLQLFAYYIADSLGREIDLPRNLAKSVTVE